MTKIIQVYDPPMCCSTGLCGTNIDTELIRVSAWLNQLRKRGVTVERQNLSQQPMAYDWISSLKTRFIQKVKLWFKN
jgi:aryl carrier-like protein